MVMIGMIDCDMQLSHNLKTVTQLPDPSTSEVYEERNGMDKDGRDDGWMDKKTGAFIANLIATYN